MCPVACGYPAAAGNRRGPALGGYRLRQRVDRGVPSAAVCWVDAELPPALVDLPLDGLGRRAEFVDEGLADRLGRDWESVQPEEDLEQARVLGVLAPSQQRDQLPLGAVRVSPVRRSAVVADATGARYQATSAERLQQPFTDCCFGPRGGLQQCSAVGLG